MIETPPIQLQRHPFVTTRSLEEARALQSSITAPVEVEVTTPRVPFEWQANRVLVAGLGIVASRYRTGVRGRATHLAQAFSWVLPVERGARATQCGRTVDLAPGRTAALYSPGDAAEFELEQGYHGLQVALPVGALEATLQALTGGAFRAPLRFELAVDLRAGPGADAHRLLEFLVREADREPTVLRAPIVVGRLSEALQCALLLGLTHNYSALLRAPERAAEPAYVKRAAEYLEARAHEPLTVTELAAEVGISARRLYAAFRAHRGCTPRAFLEARRMELARARLGSGAATAVTEVALACGFEHLGRFSTRYRARFGESPRETLRRARGGPPR